MAANDFRSIDYPPDRMEQRTARFEQLVPIASQRDPSIPQQALDVIYSRKLLPVIGLDTGADTPLATSAPIRGAGGITITLAICPPRQGPGLHAHKRTFETFTVLQGRFEFRWGDVGEHTTVLSRFDALSVPPGVARAFRNVSEEDGILQVIISGGTHDMKDVHVPRGTAAALKEASPKFYEQLAASGITFDDA